MFDRAKLALKACALFPSIQQIEFVFREMFVCICKGSFSPFGVSQQLQQMRLSLACPLYKSRFFTMGLLCFLTEF